MVAFAPAKGQGETPAMEEEARSLNIRPAPRHGHVDADRPETPMVSATLVQSVPDAAPALDPLRTPDHPARPPDLPSAQAQVRPLSLGSLLPERFPGWLTSHSGRGRSRVTDAAAEETVAPREEFRKQ